MNKLCYIIQPRGPTLVNATGEDDFAIAASAWQQRFGTHLRPMVQYVDDNTYKVEGVLVHVVQPLEVIDRYLEKP